MARPRVTESEVVLDAASAHLTAHGIGGTTVDDVAAAAGVSRATVYRYVGGKDDLVQAVIAREFANVLDRAGAAIARSATATEAVADAVTEALLAVEENPLLARLTSGDLVETLPHATVDSAPLVSVAVERLGSAWRASPQLGVDGAALGDTLDEAIEEATRFCLAHVTTPRRDGSRLTPQAAGRRAAALVEPLLHDQR